MKMRQLAAATALALLLSLVNCERYASEDEPTSSCDVSSHGDVLSPHDTMRFSTHDELEEEAMSNHGTIYDFTVKDADGHDASLDKYRGQVVIIVNVASKCGFTSSNYKQLKILSDKYYQLGLRVAAFPCNQFGGQEPGCELDVKNFVKDNYEFEPDLYAKINVNGASADPLWNFLKKEQGGTLIDAIKWNFTKFLINRRGHVVKRYAPTTEPSKMEVDIEELLAEKP